jgi:transcriptional regulator with XRE-family HTH domain
MAGTDIGRDLRAFRERHGWTRETLAHHAGISWAAIAQIEAGRRPNPRLSTVIALADALGVAVDQLTGRATPADRVPHRLQHRVLLYTTDAEFVDATVPFLTAGVEQSDAVLVVTARSRIRRLRRALGRDAGRVLFRESSSWYSSPQAALDGYRMFLEERLRGGCKWVRVVGELVLVGRPAREIRAWARYESIFNISFAASPATVICAYDTQSLSASIVADARRTHPEVVIGTSSGASPNYRHPEAFLLER